MSKDKSLRGKIRFAELTHTGMVREHNEDAIGSNADMGLMVLAPGAFIVIGLFVWLEHTILKS